MKLASGHEVLPLEREKEERLKRDVFNMKESIRLNPGGSVYPKTFLKFADKIHNFKLKESDVFVMTYPKCGTNWTQEIIWTMRNNPNLDHSGSCMPLLARSPFLEFDMSTAESDSPSEDPIYKLFLEMCPGKNPEDGVNLQLAETIPDPRTIKTHLMFSLMPPSMLDTSKVVYVARNPKDVIISFHHHFKIRQMTTYVGSFEDFVQYFLDGDLTYGPYWLHLKEAWERRNHPNLHFIFFEDLKENPLQEIKKLNTFLDTKLTEEQMEGIVKYTSFGEMKARLEKEKFSSSEHPVKSETEIKRQEYIKKAGGFFRKGEVGDWKSKFTPELDAKVTHWIQNNTNSFGFNFKYGI